MANISKGFLLALVVAFALAGLVSSKPPSKSAKVALPSKSPNKSATHFNGHWSRLRGKREMDFCNYVRNNIDYVNSNTLLIYQLTCSNTRVYDEYVEPKPETRVSSEYFFKIIYIKIEFLHQTFCFFRLGNDRSELRQQ
jgi:hypothetical protein